MYESCHSTATMLRSDALYTSDREAGNLDILGESQWRELQRRFLAPGLWKTNWWHIPGPMQKHQWDSFYFHWPIPQSWAFPPETCNLKLVGAGREFAWQDTDYKNPDSVNYRTETRDGYGLPSIIVASNSGSHIFHRVTFHILQFNYGKHEPQFCSVDKDKDGKPDSNYICTMSLDASPFPS